MEFPEKIYATERIGSNGVSCLDYRNFDEDIEYIRGDLVDKLEKNLEKGLDYLMSVSRKDLNIEDALEAFGFGRNGSG